MIIYPWLEQAAAHLHAVWTRSAAGSAGVIVDNQIMVASLFSGPCRRRTF